MNVPSSSYVPIKSQDLGIHFKDLLEKQYDIVIQRCDMISMSPGNKVGKV